MHCRHLLAADVYQRGGAGDHDGRVPEAAGLQIGLRVSRRIPFFNGPIECRLLKYELYAGTREKYGKKATQD